MTRARDVADTQDNLGGAVPPFAAGKNKIINGDMRIWQRGTTANNAGVVYGADQWRSFSYSGSSSTISQQTFTPGTAPVAGYEGQFFLRCTSTNTQTLLWQNIEDVRTFAGQTVTVSFWAKVASARNVGVVINQNFGSGGSSAVSNSVTLASAGATTSWQRFTGTIALPSISGKTIGTSSFLQVELFHTGINNALDIWGVQVEAGSVATPFQTATGTIQGELAACQRYYNKLTNPLAVGSTRTTAKCLFTVPFPVEMRIAPTATYSAASTFFIDATGSGAATGVGTFNSKTFQLSVDLDKTGLTQYQGALVSNNGTSTIEMSSEL